MASYQKFNQFVQDLANKKHDLSADSFKVMLVNTAPVATNSIKSDLTDIAAGNGYTAGGTASTITSSTQTSGTEKWILTDVVFTASGGAAPYAFGKAKRRPRVKRCTLANTAVGDSATASASFKLLMRPSVCSA